MGTPRASYCTSTVQYCMSIELSTLHFALSIVQYCIVLSAFCFRFPLSTSCLLPYPPRLPCTVISNLALAAFAFALARVFLIDTTLYYCTIVQYTPPYDTVLITRSYCTT